MYTVHCIAVHTAPLMVTVKENNLFKKHSWYG